MRLNRVQIDIGQLATQLGAGVAHILVINNIGLGLTMGYDIGGLIESAFRVTIWVGDIMSSKQNCYTRQQYQQSMDELRDRLAQIKSFNKGASFAYSSSKAPRTTMFSSKDSKEREANLLKIYKAKQRAKEDPQKSPPNYKISNQNTTNPFIINNPTTITQLQNNLSVITNSKLFKQLQAQMAEMIAQHTEQIQRLRQTDNTKRIELQKIQKGVQDQKSEILNIEARIDDLKVEILEEEDENYYLTNMEGQQEGQYQENEGEQEAEGEMQEEEGGNGGDGQFEQELDERSSEGYN